VCCSTGKKKEKATQGVKGPSKTKIKRGIGGVGRGSRAERENPMVMPKVGR